ncbi:hypothetical protein PMAYCL1PPCAC_28776, partial [Pristionchus mayeri]
VGLRFGDPLFIMANQNNATFKTDSKNETNLPVTPSCLGNTTTKPNLCFTVNHPKMKLRDRLNGSTVVFIEDKKEIGSTSAVDPLFWQKIHELTPCDPSLIVDD